MDDPTTTITITPTLSQPVQLECQRTDAFKDWFTGDPRSKVTPTEGEISTKSGYDRTLLISSFKPIHATTYSCIVAEEFNRSISTVYPVVLGIYIYIVTCTVYRVYIFTYMLLTLFLKLLRPSKLCIVIYVCI